MTHAPIPFCDLDGRSTICGTLGFSMVPTLPQLQARPTPLAAVLALTALGSVSTGVFWNAITFVAKHGYSFSPGRNAALYMTMGVIYAIGAWTSGRLTRRCERLISVRSFLAVVLLVQAAMAALPYAAHDEWALWVSALTVAWMSSLMWPIVESYVSSGRHGPELRRAIGWFNVVWMVMVAAPLIAMGSFLADDARLVLVAQAPVYLLGLPALLAFAPRPAHHDEDETHRHVGAEYPLLLRSARLLLPASYVLNAALSPVLPYRFAALGTPVDWETPITSTWMLVRVVVVLGMWRLGFWHGRWGTLLIGGVLMSVGFALTVLAPVVPVMLLGLSIFGAGMGVIYYAALYYAMAVGQGGVDAGGTHEALIGAGYTVGPAAVLAARSGALVTGIAVPWAIVSAVSLLVVGAGAAAFGPYREATRRRRGNVGTLRS